MRKDRLKGFVVNCSDFSFRVGGYVIPKMMNTYSGNRIDLEKNRENNLNQESFWSPRFEEFLKISHNRIPYIKEFPFIIENRSLWNSLCIKYDVDLDLRDKNYFLADYFFPEHNLIVEIDSWLHDKNYDLARNEYINLVWGTYSLRFYEFGKLKVRTKKFMKKFNSYINRISKIKEFYNVVGCIVNIDYSDYIVNDFCNSNSDIMFVLDELEQRILNNYPRSGRLMVDKDSISYSMYKTLLDQSDFERIHGILCMVYNIDVIIKPSIP